MYYNEENLSLRRGKGSGESVKFWERREPYVGSAARPSAVVGALEKAGVECETRTHPARRSAFGIVLREETGESISYVYVRAPELDEARQIISYALRRFEEEAARK